MSIDINNYIDSHYYCALLRMRALTGDHALNRDEKVVRLKPDQPYRWLRPCKLYLPHCRAAYGF